MNNLKQIRIQQELSGQGLAVKAGLSTATVTAIERYFYVPTAPTRNRIGAALGVGVDVIWPELGVDSKAVDPLQEATGEQVKSS